MGELRRPTDRVDVERGLDRVVAENRFTIAVVFPLVGAVLLLASAEDLLPAILAFNPYLVLTGVLVMRAPLIAGLLPLIRRRGALALGALTAYAYGIEWIGATTGFPYGDFHYDIPLGPMVFDTIPVGLPVFFLPLVLNSYLLCLLLLGDRARSALVRLPVVVAAVLAVDLVLDPAAVALGFWDYGGGVYYGVPLSNYAGWVLSATVATVLVDAAFDHDALVERVQGCPYMLDDLVSFVVLWGAVNAFYGAWIPVAVAALFAAGLLRLDRFDFAVWRGAAGRQSG
ncbi:MULTISPECIES: bisanhydrobacterioruberin hydratase [Salinibaculum]|uniref:bisanhydrobacterioruberin hydratase n=1 Tax=Salinibaculum TaxID=2732368 RepID=UPI0030CDD594